MHDGIEPARTTSGTPKAERREAVLKRILNCCQGIGTQFRGGQNDPDADDFFMYGTGDK
jgi:hypothetical protein